MRTLSLAWPRGAAGLLLAVTLGLAANAQTDGTRKWASSTAAGSFVAGDILSSPSLALDGTIYVGTEVGTSATAAGRLVAFSPDGTIKWKFDAPEWIDSSPLVAPDGTIYFGCWDGNLYALNADGTKRWSVELGLFASGSPARGPDGTLYVGTGGGDLYAITPAGEVTWFFPTLDWIEASPVVGPDGTIYVGSDDNRFYAVNPDGSLKWSYTTGDDVVSSAAIGADGVVYVGSRDLKLYAFHPNGTVKWTFQTSDHLDASPVLGHDGTIYVGTKGGRLHALRPDGTQKWQYPAAGQPPLNSIYSTPAVRGDGSILFGSDDGALFALRPDGTLAWKAQMNDLVSSSPVVAPDGTVYIGCSDKNLYAFGGTVAPLHTDWPQFQRSPQRVGAQPMGAVSGTSGRLANLSVRTQAGSADATLIVGFSVGGAGARSLLVRAVGPTLSSFGVGGAIADPMLQILPIGQSTVIAANNNWGDANPASISTTANTVGAFPLPAGSLDAAVLGDFTAGGRTAQITGTGGVTGIALVELYDNGGSDTARLTNVSARSQVSGGTGVLIAGFVVADRPRTLLIRAVGPTLGTYGVAGALARPELRVHSSHDGRQTVVADNRGWSASTNAAALASVAQSVYASALARGSEDSALLVTLPPGSYTAQVSGSGATGVALVEVYEVP